MSTHNIPFQYIKENQPKLSQICSYWIFSKGLEDEFETATEVLLYMAFDFCCISLVYSSVPLCLIGVSVWQRYTAPYCSKAIRNSASLLKDISNTVPCCLYSRSSVAQTLMAHLTWLFRTRSCVPWKNMHRCRFGTI